VAAVGARPGPSSFAPIFGASPQYRTFGAPSILRSWIEPRNVQISARPVDLVGETESLEAGSTRLAKPRRPSSSRSYSDLGTFLPLGRAAGSSFVLLHFGIAKLSISDCQGLLLATCPLLMGRLRLGACGGTSSGTPSLFLLMLLSLAVLRLLVYTK